MDAQRSLLWGMLCRVPGRRRVCAYERARFASVAAASLFAASLLALTVCLLQRVQSSNVRRVCRVSSDAKAAPCQFSGERARPSLWLPRAAHADLRV